VWVLCGCQADKQGFGLVWVLSKDKVRVLGGAKQTSKGLAWYRVLCKDRVRV
jgi:hypothetical protein